MNNTIGIISMQYQRPFSTFGQLDRWKSAGFDFVEFLVPEPDDIDLGQLRSALTDSGLFAVLAARVNLERNLSSENPGVRLSGRDYLNYCLDVAHALDASTVSGPLYGSPLVFAGRAPHPVPESLRQARVDWCVEGLKQVAETAGKAGIRLAIEPLNRFETDLLNTTRQGVELMKLVNMSNVGLTLDTFHMNMEDDDLCEAVRLAGPYLAHFQANENHRGYLGTGHIDWTGIVRALDTAAYRGTITLEPFRRTDERIGIPFAQWKPPLHDEQAQLAASCALIRNLIDLNGGRQ